MAETDERGAGHGREPAAGIPRWVKVFGIIAAFVILLLVIVLLVGGNHGPSRHTGGVGGIAPTFVAAQHGPGKS